MWTTSWLWGRRNGQHAPGRGPVPGLALTHRIACDPEIGEEANVTYTLPDASTPEQIATAMARVSEAGWYMIRMHNARKIERSRHVREERRRKILAAKQNGTRLSEKMLSQEEVEINTAIAKLEAELAADDLCLQRGAGERIAETIERGRVLDDSAHEAPQTEANGQGG